MKDVATMKEELKKLIDTAAGRVPADLVIKNCKIVNVFSGKIQKVTLHFQVIRLQVSARMKVRKSLMQKEDMRHLDLSTVTSILNLLM